METFQQEEYASIFDQENAAILQNTWHELRTVAVGV